MEYIILKLGLASSNGQRVVHSINSINSIIINSINSTERARQLFSFLETILKKKKNTIDTLPLLGQ